MREPRQLSRSRSGSYLISWLMADTHVVTCPYCGEELEIYVEPDVRGQYVQDCEVCCNPWTVRVTRQDDEAYVELGRADGSE